MKKANVLSLLLSKPVYSGTYKQTPPFFGSRILPKQIAPQSGYISADPPDPADTAAAASAAAAGASGRSGKASDRATSIDMDVVEVDVEGGAGGGAANAGGPASECVPDMASTFRVSFSREEGGWLPAICEECTKAASDRAERAKSNFKVCH